MNIDYSVVIPAYNEADWLPATLAALKQAMLKMPLQGEIIVCDNNSSDATAACANSLGAVVVTESYNQISRARNTGARAAQGQYLIFLDADTIVPEALLAESLKLLQSGDCSGGGAVVNFDIPINRVGLWGLKVWTWVSVKLGLAAGCFIFCSREDFEHSGGFSEKVYASEEIWFSRALHRIGKKRGQHFSIITDYPVLSSGRKMQWFSMGKQGILLLMLIVFPFVIRYRKFCWFWYKRPDK
ncbi:MAG: glycosyltransferase [Gammaproteobacteria bacterium]|nr:glycosyltransferase [Gammaproteobacteria bacterium]